MSLNDAILITAIGLMLYGIVQHILNDDEFWLSPIGNVIGAIAVTVIVGAAFPLTLQDDAIILVATVLALFWMTRGKRRRHSLATPAGNVAFDQVFTPVAVDKASIVGESEDEQLGGMEKIDEQIDQVAPESEATTIFTWNGA